MWMGKSAKSARELTAGDLRTNMIVAVQLFAGVRGIMAVAAEPG
jgi:hypothetical protein